MRHALALLLALGLGAGCGPTRPPKPPTPPTPTPAPAGTPLLKVVGNQFVPPILGSVTTHHGWPLCDKDCLDAINSAGLNYTAMRLPCELDDRPEYDMFVRVDADRVDLTRYNPAWDALHERTIAHADKLGIYVNQGLWDGWCAKHEGELRLFWKAAHNLQGVDIGSCSTFQRAPHPVVLSVVRHVETVIGKHANVIWELGNEANRCSPTDEFVDGVRQAVYDSETANGHLHHLWSPGTVEGSARGSRLDYLSMHGLPVPAESAPIEINEFAPQGKAEYLAHLADAKRLGITLHYWHDEPPNGSGWAWDSPAWEQEWLDVMAAMRAVPAATGCTKIPGEEATSIQPRPEAPKEWSDAINAAMKRLKPACDVGGACGIETGMQVWLNAVAEEVRKGDPAHPPLCAAVQVDSEGPVDEVCIGQEKRCTGFHAYACRPGCATGTVAWAPGSHRDTWVTP